MNYPVQQPQYPGFPQQPVAAPPFPGFPPQQAFGQPMQAQPAVPLAQGTIDDYYGQPSASGGPAISWKGKPDGTTYQGVVARDVSNADIQQETDPQTRQPKFFRDGRPKFVMKVTLRVQPSQEFPEGEATLFVRGQMRDELVRAMAEAGTGGAPKAGDAMAVTLTHRKPTNSIPQNVFAIRYAAAQAQSVPVATSPAPVVEQVAQQVVPQQPVMPTAPAAQQTAPAQGVAVPPDFTPEQAQLLQQLNGGAQA